MRSAVLMVTLAASCGGVDPRPEIEPPPVVDAAAGIDTRSLPDAARDALGQEVRTDGSSGSWPTGNAFVYVGGGSDIIHLVALDLATGVLSRTTTVAFSRPAHVTLSPDARVLYAVGGSPARATPFAVNRATGGLTRVEDGEVRTGAQGATHVVAHPTGRWVLVPHYASAEIVVLPVRAGGVLGAVAESQRTGDEAQQAVVAPGGRFVLVPCRSGNLIAQLVLDPATGKLSANDPPSVPAASGAAPRRLVFQPDGRTVHVLNEVGASVTSYRFDGVRGTLSDARTVATVPSGVDERAAGQVAVHPSGRFVYASNRNHGSVAVFAAGSDDRLRPVEFEQAGGLVRVPRDFAIDAGGNWLVVANQATGTLLALRIDPASGRLSRAADPLNGFGSPTFVEILSP